MLVQECTLTETAQYQQHNNHNSLLTSFVIFWMALPMHVHYQHNVSFSEFDDDSEISQRQLQEHPEWTRHE